MTVKLWISSTVRRNSDADELLREFAEKKGITGRDFNHLCLLTEETLGELSRQPRRKASWPRSLK